MASGRVLGHAPCPYCSAPDAEVKNDKGGNPYIVCFECGDSKKPVSQHFTLGDKKLIARLLGGGKFKPLPGVELPEWAKPAAPAPAPEPAPAPAPTPKKKTTLLG